MNWAPTCGIVESRALCFNSLFIDRMKQNEELFAKFMNEADFARLVRETLMRQVYERIREEPAA
jgi:type I restriction enzyme, R subunit